MSHTRSRFVALAHACYYLITGVWPLLSIGTFEKVTGPKTDRWLVKTVGILVGVGGRWGGAVYIRSVRSVCPARMVERGEEVGGCAAE